MRDTQPPDAPVRSLPRGQGVVEMRVQLLGFTKTKRSKMLVRSTVFKRPTFLQQKLGYSRVDLPVSELQSRCNHLRLQDNLGLRCV